MAQAPVDLQIRGQTYRVIASSQEDELKRLAARVERALLDVTGPNRPLTAQNLLLAAMKLAHDAEAEQNKRLEVERRSREALRSLLARIDAALDEGTQISASAPQAPAP